MIVCSLQGGLGNQMFQYAFGRRVALGHGVRLLLDASWFPRPHEARDPAPDKDLRFYALDCFNLYRGVRVTFHRSWPQLGRHLLPRPHGIPWLPSLVQEKGLGFDREALEAPKHSYLDGYWQYGDYFRDIEATLRQDFTFKQQPDARNQDFARRISQGPSVSVHIRRGDYLNSSSVLPLSYYEAAVQELSRKLSHPHFFLFSDDTGWCMREMQLDVPMTVVDVNPPASAHKDLQLMGLCEHHILANSSLSWWAAWLNQRPNKIVIAPQAWLPDRDGADSKSFIPDSWITM